MESMKNKKRVKCLYSLVCKGSCWHSNWHNENSSCSTICGQRPDIKFVCTDSKIKILTVSIMDI